MSILDSLVTDRTAADAAYIRQLAALGLAGRSAAQQRDWLYGDGTAVLTAQGVELLAQGVALEVRAGSPKGAYNYTDLNRVNEALSYCQTALAAAGISVALSGVKTDWAEDDVPTEAQMDAYAANVTAMREAVNTPADMPEAPESMDGLDYAGANAIELILLGVGIELERIKAAWYRCGQSNLYCGGFALPIGGD